MMMSVLGCCLFCLSLLDILQAYKVTRLPKANNDLNIFALPVGQGDCTIIQCPITHGAKISIIDIGSRDSRGFKREDVVDFIDNQVIETVILTHPHEDHINYLDAVLNGISDTSKYPVVYHSCNWSQYFSIKHDITKRHRIEQCCNESCPVLDICNGNVILDVIASEQANCELSPNGASVVTQIKYAGIKTIIAGDFEGTPKEIGKFLTCAGNIKSHICRLAHHGAANNANSKVYLEAISPMYAFSSSGLTNKYKHPSCRSYEFLQNTLTKVPAHPYTCSNSSWTNMKTTTAIYTTTVMINNESYGNYILQFAISKEGTINVTFDEV